jgi:hypothetical protein
LPGGPFLHTVSERLVFLDRQGGQVQGHHIPGPAIHVQDMHPGIRTRHEPRAALVPVAGEDQLRCRVPDSVPEQGPDDVRLTLDSFGDIHEAHFQVDAGRHIVGQEDIDRGCSEYFDIFRNDGLLQEPVPAFGAAVPVDRIGPAKGTEPHSPDVPAVPSRGVHQPVADDAEPVSVQRQGPQCRVRVVVAVDEDEDQSQFFEQLHELGGESSLGGELGIELIRPEDLQVTDMDDELVPVPGSAGQDSTHPWGAAVPVAGVEDLLEVSGPDAEVSERFHAQHVYGSHGRRRRRRGRTPQGMTNTAVPQPRVKTGQYTFAEHSEAGLALAAPAELKLTADLRDPISSEHRAAIDHWHGRLQDSGVSGELEILSIDGGDTDAGGPTVTGTWRSPDGADFGFAVDHKNVELSRGIDWSLDAAHLGDSSSTSKDDGSTISDEDLATTFTTVMDRARISDGWAKGTAMRSNDKFRFAIPERISEDQGHEAGQVSVTAVNGDEYLVQAGRGGADVRVYGPHQGQLSDRMATAFLTDVSESCGGSGGPDDVQNALRHAMEAGTGDQW